MINVLFDTIRCQFLRLAEWVLELFLKILNDEARPFRFRKIERLGVVTEFDCVDPDKVNLALILSGNWSEESNMLIFFLFGRVEEKVSKC